MRAPKIVHVAKTGGSEVALIVNWTRGPEFFNGDVDMSQRYGAWMAHGTRALAEFNIADVIDLAGAFCAKPYGCSSTSSGSSKLRIGPSTTQLRKRVEI